MPSLTHQALKGALWTFFQRGGQQVIRFVISVILARILLPEHFGLVAMLEVFIAVSERLIYAGFGGALVQKKEVNQTDLSTLFWYNLAVACACYLVLFISAPWIAAFFRQPELSAILRVAALGLICMGFQVVQGVHFFRRLDFRIPTLVSIGALVVSAVIGITMALNGFGVWALVYTGLSRRFVEVVLLWMAAKWRPTFEFSRPAMHHIFRFGGPVTLASLLGALFNNLHVLVIGRVYAAANLGFFNRGRAVQQIAQDATVQPVNMVLFPALSRISDDPERTAKAYLRALRVVAFVVFPALFAVALVAEPLISTLYSARWLEAAPYLRWLCITGGWLPLAAIGLMVLKAGGSGMRYLALSSMRHLLVVAGIAATYQTGILEIIIAVGIAQFLAFVVLCVYLARCIPARVPDQGWAVAPSLLTAVAAFLALRMVPVGEELGPVVQFLGGAAAFGFAYGLVALLLRFRALGDLVQLAKEWRSPPTFVSRMLVRLESWVVREA